VSNILLIPPLTFTLIFIFMLLQFWFLARLAYKAKSSAPGKRKAYACGEDIASHQARPEYSQFFQFAFFFTIMHVVAMIVATVPGGQFNYIALAIFYILAAIIGLFILYRR
jgi:NADH:ubiquinone oxidoreductase subunit 3 (subunit A)